MFCDVGDSELIYLLRCDNNDAKECLFSRYKKRIYGIIKSFASKHMEKIDYDDAYQDCMIIFLKCLELFDDEYNFYNYLTISLDKGLKRKREKESAYQNILSLDYVNQQEDLSYLDLVEDEDVVYSETQLQDFISNNFSEVEKQIIEYKKVGYSYLEISKILGLSKKKMYTITDNIKSIFEKNWLKDSNI